MVQGLVLRIGDVEWYQAVGAALAGRVGCVLARIGELAKLWAGAYQEENL